MRRVRENIIPIGPKGGTALTSPLLAKASDLDTLFDPNTGAILPPVGTHVVYSEVTGQIYDSSSDADDLAAVDTLTFATVVMGSNGKTLLKAFGDRIYRPYVTAAKYQEFGSGTVGIAAMYFSCTKCDTPYSFAIAYETDTTLNTFPYNRTGLDPITIQSPCCGDCDDCDDDLACGEVARKIVDFVNGTWAGPLSGFDRKAARANALARPYVAMQIFENFNSFVVPLDANGQIDTAITKVSDGTNDVTITGTDVENLVATVNADGNISAAAEYHPGDPTKVTLHFSAAGGAVALTGGGATAGLAVTDMLSGTDEAYKGQGQSCGVAFVPKKVPLDCDCFPPNPPKGYKTVKIEPIIGQDWRCGQAYATAIQVESEPINSGYDWTWRAYAQDNGGIGRTNRPYNSMFGPINLPTDGDRAKTPTLDAVDCGNKHSLSLQHNIPYKDTGVHGNVVAPKGRTILLWNADQNTAVKGALKDLIDNWLKADGIQVQGNNW